MVIDRSPAAVQPIPVWSRIDWAALAVVTVGAAALRLPGLARPIDLVFDEIFYARNACRYVIGSEAVCGIDELASRAHPPLGNWLIGVGVKIVGYQPFGWRVVAAAAGILTVVLTYLLARRLLRGVSSPGAATVGSFAAAGLLATDFLHLVQSRIAMLDVLVTLFVASAALAVVLDRDHALTPSRGLVARLTLGRPWRLVAGVALGAATATKWSGAYVALAVIGLVAYWEVVARLDERGWRSALWRAVREEVPRSVVLLGVVPVVAYLASYIGRMPGELIELPWRDGTVWRGIWEHQRAMLDFHTSLGGHHPYESAPWSWVAIKRPVAYFFTDEGGTYREILAIGNPLVWWPGVTAIVAVAVRWLRSGDPWGPGPVVVAGVLATYGTWIALSGTRSQVFLWYLLPALPFLCVALGTVVAWAWRSLPGRAVAGAFGVAVIAALAFALPILTALPLEPDDWRQRILFADCERPGAPTMRLPDDETSSGPPPIGWCWI